jgi:hypothetical protein
MSGSFSFLPHRRRGTVLTVEGREPSERGTTAPFGRGPSVASRHLPETERNL